MSVALDAAAVVANCLRTVEPHERAETCRELMGHAAAALEIFAGRPVAAEAIYRLADVVVARETSEDGRHA